MNAKQIRTKLEEMLGGLVLIRVADGLKVRRKRGPKREQVLKAPEFEGSRGSLGDFVMCSRAGKTLRFSLQQGLNRISDRGMYNRLTSVFCKVVKADIDNPAGSRHIGHEQLRQLKGFEFNGKTSLGSVLFAPYQTNISRARGEAAVTLKSFSAAKLVFAPPGATHFILHAAASAVHFKARESTSSETETIMIPVNATDTGDITLRMQLQAGTDAALFVALGIQFVNHSNGISYPLLNSEYNALRLVEAGVPGIAVEEHRSQRVLNGEGGRNVITVVFPAGIENELTSSCKRTFHNVDAEAEGKAMEAVVPSLHPKHVDYRQ
jgi:hypothetical protein